MSSLDHSMTDGCGGYQNTLAELNEAKKMVAESVKFLMNRKLRMVSKIQSLHISR